MKLSGKMPNDKLREVKRSSGSESPRFQHARAVATQPVREFVDQPRLLSDRFRLLNDRRKLENDHVLETFRLPLDAARRKVRAIIDDISQRGYREIVERWRQLPDGQIEFTMRRLPVPD
jgi:hypothetical protein